MNATPKVFALIEAFSVNNLFSFRIHLLMINFQVPEDLISCEDLKIEMVSEMKTQRQVDLSVDEDQQQTKQEQK